MLTYTIRPATDADLAPLHALWYATEVVGEHDPPPLPTDILPGLPHVLATGDLLLAERDGGIVGFAGLLTRGNVAFLTDLFVHSAAQSAGIGQALLERILPRDGRVLSTAASTDPRAPALYIRAGMRPQWPLFWLLGESQSLGPLAAQRTELIEADPSDPALAVWDSAIGGRPRPEDLTFLLSGFGAAPFWFERGGRRIGYGYVQRRSPESLWHQDAYTLGPIGAYTPEDAAACVVATVEWARQRAATLRLAVPGPHPALRGLLAAGLRIVAIETFLASGEAPFVDGRCYLPSGGTLF
jgi:GNAT superfamily N-acetyltransferase